MGTVQQAPMRSPTALLSTTRRVQPWRHVHGSSGRIALLACTLLLMLAYSGMWPFRRMRGGPQQLQAGSQLAAQAAVAKAGDSAQLAVAVDWDHPLFARIDRDLLFFSLSGISRRMVEQAYCQGSRGSFRLQVVNGSMYIAGESPSYESRLLNIKRQLLHLWLAGGLPEGIDLVIEQEDGPTVRHRSNDCPLQGPIVAPAKQHSNSSHNHVLLAPDHSFAGWLEAHTLAWEEMLPLLQHAARRQPWEHRSELLFFRGASTGDRNLTDPELTDTYPDLLEVQLVNWTSLDERSMFVSLADHCRYKLLLHLPGNSYAGRLKYLLACGSAVVMPDSPWQEFWYHLLKPGKNIVVVDPVNWENRGHHLADVAEELQLDDGLARQLGKAGAKLATRDLAPAMVQAYWKRLLERYRQLQQYNATVHPDAVLLERSILVPEIRNVTRRTCGVCKPLPEQFEEEEKAAKAQAKAKKAAGGSKCSNASSGEQQ